LSLPASLKLRKGDCIVIVGIWHSLGCTTW
jgi:hypothetical protein